MGKIQKLPDHIANKIAAGEVVERPASVVKELVENSIDAQATQISIHIEKAGKQLIQIIDNGEGMTPEDARLAFERHATSKIRTSEDLERIGTLGFRGEALPSIASVSIIELKTRTADSELGSYLHFTGGQLDWEKPVQMEAGTQLSVKNLFFNTPARRHFLRTDATELQHIITTLKRFFISFPHISFKVYVNNKIIFDFPSESIDNRLKNVFGKSIYDGFIRFQEEKNGIRLEGYIARPDLARNSRGMEFFFLNHRPIENRSLHHAVIQAYGNTIERRQYPPYVMYLEVPPEEVDVNVHPTKMEVKFRKEHIIYQLFYHSIKNALNRENVIPVYGERPNKSEFNFTSYGNSSSSGSSRFSYSQQGRLDLHGNGPFPKQDTARPTEAYVEAIKQMGRSKFTDLPSSEERDEHAVPLFQLHNKYILAQSESGLMIIDQHVAHERILYEKALISLENKERMPTQQLLFPQTIELNLEDYLIYEEIKDALHMLGFATTPLSGRTIILESIPTTVKPGYEHKIFLEMIDYFKQFDSIKNTNNDVIAAAYACKNAIKSGDKISKEEMEFLLGELFKCKEPFFCPHGRPVIITLPLEELDRKFKRIK